MCYFLRGITTEAKGQIAHLDQDNQNPEPDNLAFLCLDCHRDYDSTSNRTVGYTPEEIKHYRDELHLAIGPDQVEWIIRVRTPSENYEKLKPVIDSVVAQLKKTSADVQIQEGSGT